MQPSPEADRRTLIRRLTFDLHGLPPTPEEIDGFLGDDAPDAYEKLVDRLLASPRYGERWGRHWLDVVHYGDTHGYDKDKRRDHAWPYRDYVIRSLNDDVPYSPIHPRASRRRRARAGRPAGRDRHRVHRGRSVGLRRPRRAGRKDRRQAQDPADRPRRHGGQHDVHLRQPDGPLRPLPRPQVRPDPPARLLPTAGGLRGRRSRRPAV